jgi:DNA uptake protein ComE-like DNA-binding protein
MTFPRSFLRFMLMAIAMIFTVVSLNNCSVQSPPSESAASPAAISTAPSNGDPKININSAILSQLDKLEAQLGVPALSNQIQAGRPYSTIEELYSKRIITKSRLKKSSSQAKPKT